MPKVKELGVWIDDVHVANLVQRRRPEISCRYTEEALDLWPQNSPVISCSLPLQPRAEVALSFCKGLLPEGQALQTMAARAGLAVNDTFGLLARYGRDVAGALVIGAEKPEPRNFDLDPYTEESLRAEVDDLEDHPLGTYDDSELSLAGLQDKLLLVSVNGNGWARPLHGRPSTHILKVDNGRHPGLVDAEALCLELAKAAGLTTIDYELRDFGETRCLIVSRFDRSETRDGELKRIHQEDLCQALAVDSDQHEGRGKYEAAGGPSFRQAAALLDAYADDPESQLERLISVAVFTVLIGNADAHGKNLALLHPTPSTVELAPLYDTVPTVLWPTLHSEAAMAVGAQVMPADVTIADFLREAKAWNFAEERALGGIERTTHALVSAAKESELLRGSKVAKAVIRRARQLR